MQILSTNRNQDCLWRSFSLCRISLTHAKTKKTPAPCAQRPCEPDWKDFNQLGEELKVLHKIKSLTYNMMHKSSKWGTQVGTLVFHDGN